MVKLVFLVFSGTHQLKRWHMQIITQAHVSSEKLQKAPLVLQPHTQTIECLSPRPPQQNPATNRLNTDISAITNVCFTLTRLIRWSVLQYSCSVWLQLCNQWSKTIQCLCIWIMSFIVFEYLLMILIKCFHIICDLKKKKFYICNIFFYIFYIWNIYCAYHHE